MKKFQAVQKNIVVNFKNKGEAIEFIEKKPQYHYEEKNEWRYYDAYLGNSSTRFSTISGNTLIDAIEQYFKKIITSMGLYGASGYILKTVTLEKITEDKARLTITAYPFSTALVGFNNDMLKDDRLKTKTLDILDVTENEFEGKYEFELTKNI